MSTLSQETRDRIEADALTWSEQQHGHDEPNKDYLEGAATEAKRAQGLVAALEAVKNISSWIDNDEKQKNLIIERIETALAKYKEVTNG